MNPLSVCIPTYEMHGLGSKFLEHSFDILSRQTYKDFNVIISDHSIDNSIKDLCDKYSKVLNIQYYHNTEKLGNSAANLNNAIRKADGKIIKIIFQDDFLYSEKSLEDIIINFDLQKDDWMITACEHTKDGKNFIRPFYPKYNKFILFGYNTISSPSVLTIKNDHPLLFDENLIWLIDCEYYKRCYKKFGEPKILNRINVVNRIGEHQVTYTIVNPFLKLKEFLYIIKKYKRSLI
jgi:hypothetical protein